MVPNYGWPVCKACEIMYDPDKPHTCTDFSAWTKGPARFASSEARKAAPMARGLLDYFPDALAAVATLSRRATAQHHPDQPMHWERGKSEDHADCLVRHLLDRGTRDDDGLPHTAKVAWRALALLQTEIEATRQPKPPSPKLRLVRAAGVRGPDDAAVLQGK